MNREYGLFFWIHILALIVAYLSPLLIDWRLVIVGALILQVQYWLISGCYLTHLQFGKDKNEVFLWYYLHKAFPALKPESTKFFVRIVAPAVLIAIGFVIQGLFHFKPLLIS